MSTLLDRAKARATERKAAAHMAAAARDVAALRASLLAGHVSGVLVYSGPSALDGAPILVIATGFRGSENDKTGDMVQTFIVRADIAPHDAVRTGQDASVCGECVHRPSLYHAAGAAICYVQTGNAPLSVWNAAQRAVYPDITAWSADDIATLFAGFRVRCGTYGDPGAAPHVWSPIVSRAASHTGYTHQWANPVAAALRTICMASVDTLAEMATAQGAGWRTFRVAPWAGWTKEKGEGLCPASEEAGKVTTCATCGLCSGANGRARASIMIPDHSGMSKLDRARLARKQQQSAA
jgi:hypothetical protein